MDVEAQMVQLRQEAMESFDKSLALKSIGISVTEIYGQEKSSYLMKGLGKYNAQYGDFINLLIRPGGGQHAEHCACQRAGRRC